MNRSSQAPVALKAVPLQSALLKAGLFASAALLFALPSASASLAKPLVEFTFNGSGNTATSTGTNNVGGEFRNASNQQADLHSAGGLGVSGLAGDRAFNNTDSTKMGGTNESPGAGGVFRIGNIGEELSALTISGWYKSSEGATPGNFARLINGSMFNLFLSDSSSSRGLVFQIGSNSVLVPYSGAGSIYRQSNTWTFFAITFELGSSDNVKFYAGTSDADVELMFTGTISRSSSLSSSAIDLANNGSRDRPFDGYLDNFRLWDSALSEADLKQVRAADLANTQIPEASTYALLGACAAFAVVVFARRRRVVA